MCLIDLIVFVFFLSIFEMTLLLIMVSSQSHVCP